MNLWRIAIDEIELQDVFVWVVDMKPFPYNIRIEFQWPIVWMNRNAFMGGMNVSVMIEFRNYNQIY